MPERARPDRPGHHAVVLVDNALTRDARVLKQIRSLARNGYTVSALAVADRVAADHDLSDPACHIYRLPPLREHARRTPAEAVAADPVLASVGDGIAAEMQEMRERHLTYRQIRLAVKLLRLAALFDPSRTRRAATRRRLRRGLQMVRDLAQERSPAVTRIQRAIHFRLAAAEFCDRAPEWAARLAAAGPPVIVHGHDLFTAPAAIHLGAQYGAPALYDAHEYEPERNPPMPPDQRAMIEVLEDAVLDRSAALITVSKSIAGLYTARHPGLDVRLIYNCPDLRRDGPPVPGLRARCALAPDTPLAVYIGLARVGIRGLGIALEALRRLPDWHLAVLGPRLSQEDEKLRHAAEAAGVADRIHLLDPVPPGDVVPAIADADASVCLIQDSTLSYRYSMPNKLFEAALAGVPVVASDFPDMGGFVRRFGAGLTVDQTDAAAVAEALETLRADRARFVPRDAARAALEAECSWEAQEQALLGLYRTLAADPRDADPRDAGAPPPA